VVADGPGNPGWLLFYGAVTDLNGMSTCTDPGHSEDIFVTWSSTDGITFGQDIGIGAAPLALLTSADYETAFGTGVGASCPTCTGWHIGDPAVVYGDASGVWYMFFDTQSCLSASSGAWDPLSVATSTDWKTGWVIRSQLNELPGNGNNSFPCVFKDPSDGRIYLYYSDEFVQTRVVELVDDGLGTTFLPVNGGAPLLPNASVDRLSVYQAASGVYYAIGDNFGAGTPAALNTLWRMGPSNSPIAFDWNGRKPVLGAGDWYSYNLWAPSCLGPMKTRDHTSRIYFWGKGADGDSCALGGGTQAGVIVQKAVHEVSHTPGPGQYATINAALSAAQSGDTVRIIDNSAPYGEVVVVTTDDITLEGDPNLDPRPAIEGPSNTSPFDPGLKTAFTFDAAGLVCRNLIVRTAVANHTVIDARFGPDSVFDNVLMEAPPAALNAFRCQVPAQLSNCEIKGGLFCTEMYFSGPLVFNNCTIGQDAGILSVYISGGVVAFGNCTIGKRDGLSVIRLRTQFAGIPSEATFQNCLIFSERDGVNNGHLIEIEAGDAPSEAKRIVVDNCDLIGRGDFGSAVLYGAPGGVVVRDSIFQSIGGPVYEGIQEYGNPPGYNLGEGHCAYKQSPNLDPSLISAGTSIILANSDPLYLNVAGKDFRLFNNSPAATLNSSGTPPYAGSRGLSGAIGPTGWERPETDVMRGFGNMYNPHILHEQGAPYPYRMYFFGWASADCNPGFSGCDAIFLARSADIAAWEVYSGSDTWDGTGNPALWVPVVSAGDDYYDQWHNGDPSVVKHNGTYYMAYTATGFDLDRIPSEQSGDTDDELSVIMGATSPDGIHWTRSASPLLLYQPEVGQPNDYASPSYMGDFARPSLMYDEDRWRLWFDYWQSGPLGAGLAHAENHGDPMDANDWVITHSLSTALLVNWPNPDVVKYKGTYYLFGDPVGYPGGIGWPNRQIRSATSQDGIYWTSGDFIWPDSDAPANHVPEAFLTTVGGIDYLYLFYSNQIGGDPYNFRYDRIRSMRRPLTPPGQPSSSVNSWRLY
jgi:hypothetical protein